MALPGRRAPLPALSSMLDVQKLRTVVIALSTRAPEMSLWAPTTNRSDWPVRGFRPTVPYLKYLVLDVF